MRKYQSIDNISEEYFSKRPEEIGDFLTESFAEYANDGDSSTLLSQLRVIARVKGITKSLVIKRQSTTR